VSATIAAVAFDREIIEVELALDLIGSSDMPKIAWDALEAGLDGRGIRRLAALNSPTYFEVIEILPQAMKEMGLVKPSRGAAALRLARNSAKEILEQGKDPLKYIHYFQRLWIKADYSSKLQSVGHLSDDIYVAYGTPSDEKIREWLIVQLREFVREKTI
jgi:hypothetical protein